MSVDYLVCGNCGETFPDCSGRAVFCECGESYCCIECAEEAEYTGSSCKYCRKEDFSNDELLNYLLDKLNVSREHVIEEYKKYLED